MSQQRTIRDLKAKGMSVTEISRRVGVDRKTVYAYLARDDFSPKPPVREHRPSKLDVFKPTIDRWIAEDRGNWYKQRHTAKRVFERLRDEEGYMGSYNTVQRYVKELRADAGADDGQYLGLVWHQAEAQVDFGEADFYVFGRKVRHDYLTVSFPYSNMSYVQVFRGETAECVCQGLKDIFDHVGGVPVCLVFDNATGVGRRVCDTIMLAELFSRFALHYRLTVRFCNPASGWEKGNVERSVGSRRSNLFVPIPTLDDDIVGFNEHLLQICEAKTEEMHYRKEETVGGLFDEDRSRLLPLPETAFDVVRYEYEKTDRYGYVHLDGGRHAYSTAPRLARCEVTVGMRAHTVEVFDTDGRRIVCHMRDFGARRTERVDPASSLDLLSHRPSAWHNSHLREQMPENVVTYLDGLDRGALRHDLELLAQSSARSGLDATLSALDLLATERSELPDFFEVGCVAARISGYGLDTPPERGPDLSVYDEMFMATGVRS